MSDWDRLEEFFATILGIILILLAVWLICALLLYVFRGLALSRMARNAGFPSPFLAWVPIANYYLLGSLCERAMYARTGKTWKFSIILPVLEFLNFAGGGGLFNSLYKFSESYLRYGFDFYNMGGAFLSGVSSLLGLAYVIVMAVAFYNLYCDYAPGREVVFTVLSVIFGSLAQVIILFVIRDRVPVSVSCGGGYPPAGGYPGQPPYQGGPYTTQWNQPPRYPGDTPQWNQPPYQSGPSAPQWNRQPGTWANPQPPQPPAGEDSKENREEDFR